MVVLAFQSELWGEQRARLRIDRLLRPVSAGLRVFNE